MPHVLHACMVYLFPAHVCNYQAVTSEDHGVQWYKNAGVIGLRHKKGEKKQWISWGRGKGWSEKACRKKADEMLKKLNDGATEAEVIAWVETRKWK